MQDQSHAASAINAAIRAVDDARNEARAIRRSATYDKRPSAQRRLVALSLVLLPDVDEYS